jgi:hypothetical protein
VAHVNILMSVCVQLIKDVGFADQVSDYQLLCSMILSSSNSICHSFNNDVSVSDGIALNDDLIKMNCKGCGRKRSWSNLG